jgi:hypothetical protein
LNEKESVAIVDLSAAFDTVDHSILLSILEKEFGVCGTALLWIKNYLSPRTFTVKVNDGCSEPKSLHFSVPQVSMAGPTFYWAYASPLKTVADNHNIKINGYADDHTLKQWISGSSEGEREAIINDEECLLDVKILDGVMQTKNEL